MTKHKDELQGISQWKSNEWGMEETQPGGLFYKSIAGWITPPDNIHTSPADNRVGLRFSAMSNKVWDSALVCRDVGPCKGKRWISDISGITQCKKLAFWWWCSQKETQVNTAYPFLSQTLPSIVYEEAAGQVSLPTSFLTSSQQATLYYI